MVRRDITLQLDLDVKDLLRGLDRSERGLGELEDSTTKVTGEIEGRFDRLGRSIDFAVGDMIAEYAQNLISNLGEYFNKSFELATSIEETNSKFETVFGQQSAEVNQFLQQFAEMAGLSDLRAKELTATTGALFQGFGFGTRQSAQLTEEVTRLSADLASFNNRETEEVSQAITSALTGEREQLKQLGIVIRETDVQQEALNMTGQASVDNLTDQEKALASLNLIRERAGVAVGDLERTQQSAANQARRLRAEYENVQAALAQRLLPAFGSGIEVARSFLGVISDIVEVSMAEKIRDQQVELNALVRRLQMANVGEEERSRLITEIQNKYPGFLKNLNTEKMTTAELRDRLDEVNERYRESIMWQVAREDMNEGLRAASRAKIDLWNQEQETQEQLIRLAKDYNLTLETEGKTTQEVIDQAKSQIKYRSLSAKAIQRLGNIEGKYLTVKNKQTAAQREADKALEAYRTTVDNLGKSEQELEEQTNNLTGATSESESASENDADAKSEQAEATKGLKAEIKDAKDRITELINKQGELSEADKQEIVDKQKLINQYQSLIDQRRELTNLPTKPTVPAQRTTDRTMAADQSGPNMAGVDQDIQQGGYIINQIDREMAKRMELHELYQQLSLARQTMNQDLSDSEQQRVQQTIKALQNEISMRQQLANVFAYTTQTQIQSLQELGQVIVQETIRAVKARIAEAMSTQIAKVLATVPFPFNVAAAAAAGGAVSLLINKAVSGLIPGFRSGVDDFEGGVAKVHKGEMITYLPEGANVVNNANTSRIEQAIRNSERGPDIDKMRDTVMKVEATVNYARLEMAMTNALQKVNWESRETIKGETIERVRKAHVNRRSDMGFQTN